MLQHNFPRNQHNGKKTVSVKHNSERRTAKMLMDVLLSYCLDVLILHYLVLLVSIKIN